MKLNKMKKEDLELLSHKDITNLILEENPCMNTADLFKKIIELLELPKSTFDNKIGDYFTSLATDKRFIMLEDGTWDLQSRHESVKLSDLEDEEDEEELEEIESNPIEEEIEEDNYEDGSVDEDTTYTDDDDLSDLVVLDEDELELEQ